MSPLPRFRVGLIDSTSYVIELEAPDEEAAELAALAVFRETGSYEFSFVTGSLETETIEEVQQ